MIKQIYISGFTQNIKYNIAWLGTYCVCAMER